MVLQNIIISNRFICEKKIIFTIVYNGIEIIGSNCTKTYVNRRMKNKWNSK